MKISILPVLMGLIVPSILAGQPNLNQTAKSDTLKPARKTKPVNPDSTKFQVLRPPPLFKIYSVKELQSQTRGVKPIQLEIKPATKTDGNIQINSGRPRGSFYKTANGVVLDALKPKHSGTGSELRVYNVSFNPLVTERIRNNIPCPLYQQFEDTYFEMVGPDAGDNAVKIYPYSVLAHFSDIPFGTHTYLLTYGTDIKKDILRITVDGNVFEGDQLIHNPGSNEIRLLFIKDKLSTSHTITIVIEVAPTNWDDSGYTSHIQLVQLD